MEFRKEKSVKSKELIKKHSKSDIFNIESGYYKTENIYPITPKPNELGRILIEFSPKYPEKKHFERYFENSLSNLQKSTDEFLKLKPSRTLQHFDLEKQRTRNKVIRGYCYDKKGNFSSRQLYMLDLYGSVDVISNSKKKYFYLKKNNNNNNNIRNKSIKDKRKLLNKSSNNNNNNRDLKFKENKKRILNKNNKNYLSNLSINQTNFSIRNNLNIKDKKNEIKIKKKQIYTNINKNKNNNIINNNKNHRIDNNINDDLSQINSLIMKLSSNQKKETLNYIKNLIDNQYEISKKNKSENYPQNKSSNAQNINTKFFRRKFVLNKEAQDYDIYNIKIKNNNKNKIIDGKLVKNILYKNSLHAYNFDEDEGNQFMYEKNTITARLRKQKGDHDFDKRYQKAENDLSKKEIKMDKLKKVNYGKKKRKGTPGIELRQKVKKK